MLPQLPALAGPIIVILHGLGHGGALIALAWIAARPGSDTGAWSAARSWLLPALSAETATVVAGVFWAISLIVFVTAGLGMAGVGFLAETWRPIAVVAAVVSLTGIGLFLGTWPAFNTVAAIAVNIGILAILVMGR
jgi:hypothetical protein